MQLSDINSNKILFRIVKNKQLFFNSKGLKKKKKKKKKTDLDKNDFKAVKES